MTTYGNLPTPLWSIGIPNTNMNYNLPNIVNPNNLSMEQLGSFNILDNYTNKLINPSNNASFNVSGTDNFSILDLGKSLWDKLDFDTAFKGLEALSGLLGAYNMNRQFKLAKDQFNFQKDAWNKNYANSVKDYNNLLADKYRGRASQETGNINAYNSEYEKNKL